MDYETLTKESIHNKAIQDEEYNLISILRVTILKEGDKWCVLYGKNIQEGIYGFGNTPYEAVIDFNKSWHRA